MYTLYGKNIQTCEEKTEFNIRIGTNLDEITYKS